MKTKKNIHQEKFTYPGLLTPEEVAALVISQSDDVLRRLAKR